MPILRRWRGQKRDKTGAKNVVKHAASKLRLEKVEKFAKKMAKKGSKIDKILTAILLWPISNNGPKMDLKWPKNGPKMAPKVDLKLT